MTAESVGADATVPLVVDVDGTLVVGDLLVEGVLRLLATAPFKAYLIPYYLARGRPALKRWIAETVPVQPDTLVLNSEVMAEIDAAKADGRPVWLASGADERGVAPLAEFVGAAGFEASDGEKNLVGAAKAQAVAARFGTSGFDYIGNDDADLPVWERAHEAIGIGLSRRTAKAFKKVGRQRRRLRTSGGGGWHNWLRTLRPHQWTKNALVFVPIMAAHVDQLEAYLRMGGVFIAACCCASGAYIFNDLLDLPHDRRHARKRHRPIAAGRVPALPAAALGAVLLATGLAAAFQLSTTAGVALLVYVAATFGYSLSLKRLIVADIVALALLYVLRVAMGAEDAALSPWLLAFSLFLFLALAVVKRLTELARNASSAPAAHGLAGRGWRAEDAVVLLALGAAAVVASVVVMALYIQSPDVAVRYARPELLGIVCPLLVYWLGRLLVLANRGALDDDPVVFAVKDGVSYLVATITGCAVLLAI